MLGFLLSLINTCFVITLLYYYTNNALFIKYLSWKIIIMHIFHITITKFISFIDIKNIVFVFWFYAICYWPLYALCIYMLLHYNKYFTMNLTAANRCVSLKWSGILLIKNINSRIVHIATYIYVTFLLVKLLFIFTIISYR